MELKDILGFVDIGDVKSVDEFKEKFNSKFAPKSEVEELNRKLSESTGKMTGSATTLFKRLGELDNKDIEGKKWEEIAEMAISKYKNQIKDLEGKQGQGSDEAIKDLNKQLEKIKKERDEFKSAHETVQQTLEKTTGDYEGKIKGLKVNTYFEAAKSKVIPKLKSDLSPAEKYGFESAIKEFVVDFDDKDTPIVKDASGNMLKNPNKAGAFLSLEEALELKANEFNLIKKNTGQGGQPAPFFVQPKQDPAQPNPGTPVRTIHPNAMSHAEKLKAAQGK
jgi:hypothetical protein